MALGSVVLGGIVAGPALLVSGFVLASKGEKIKTEVREYERRVSDACAKCVSMERFIKKTHSRIDEVWSVAGELEARVKESLLKLDADTWDAANDEDVMRYQEMMILARSLADVLRVPILNESGDLSEVSSNIRLQYKAVLER